MAQLIVTIDNSSQLSAIKKAIGLIRGVAKVSIQKTDYKPSKERNMAIASDIKKLMGIASDINKLDVTNDERLDYLLNK